MAVNYVFEVSQLQPTIFPSKITAVDRVALFVALFPEIGHGYDRAIIYTFPIWKRALQESHASRMNHKGVL
jgi:hypothetical protein